MGTRRKKQLVLLAVTCVAVAVAVPTLAAATIPNNGVIFACYTKNGGTLRVIDQSVRNRSKGQTSLSWNVAGQTGAEGPQGPPGATGPAGPAGPAGSTTDYEVTDVFVDTTDISTSPCPGTPTSPCFTVTSATKAKCHAPSSQGSCKKLRHIAATSGCDRPDSAPLAHFQV